MTLPYFPWSPTTEAVTCIPQPPTKSANTACNNCRSFITVSQSGETRDNKGGYLGYIYNPRHNDSRSTAYTHRIWVNAVCP